MRYLVTCVLISFIAGGWALAEETESQNETRELFNGQDLSGWTPMHGGQWSVEDGVLIGKNGQGWSTDPTRSGSWLRTNEEYGDFILELEYAINRRGNSGIFIRAGLEKNPAFTGHEMQILDDYGREPKYTSGALYAAAATSSNRSQPTGQWNHAKIVAQGPNIHVWLNGKQVVRHVSERREQGYIGLQAHDERSVVQFRNISLTPLPQ